MTAAILRIEDTQEGNIELSLSVEQAAGGDELQVDSPAHLLGIHLYHQLLHALQVLASRYNVPPPRQNAECTPLPPSGLEDVLPLRIVVGGASLPEAPTPTPVPLREAPGRIVTP